VLTPRVTFGLVAAITVLGMAAAVGIVALQGTPADSGSKPRVAGLDAEQLPKLTFHRAHTAEPASAAENQAAGDRNGDEAAPESPPVEQPTSEGPPGEEIPDDPGPEGKSGSSEKPPAGTGEVIEEETR
jgi:hypothetical protein